MVSVDIKHHVYFTYLYIKQYSKADLQGIRERMVY